MSARDPITKQRSKWQELHGAPQPGQWPARWVARRVSDGVLRACIAEEPLGWHLSISFVNHKNEPTRYPTWDEIAHARDELLPDDIDFVMFLPKHGEYVAVHRTTFHLHEYPERIPS